MRSSFWDSKNGDRKYNADHWAEYFAKFIANGVYADPSTSMQVQADSGLTVKIAVGSCFINGREGFAEGDDYLTLDYGGSAPRIDRIVARYDKAKREIQPHIIKGTAAETPTAPALIRDGTYFDLCLADITVAANATTITQANIADRRGNTSLCGWVTGLIDQIDTEELFAQFMAEWGLLRAACAQDEEAVIAAWAALNATKTVNGIAPVSGNITLKQGDIPIGNGAYQMPFKMLKGTVTTTTSGTTEVKFSESFASIPTVICTAEKADTTISVAYTAHMYSVNTNLFRVYAKKISGSSETNIQATVHWVAFGV